VRRKLITTVGVTQGFYSAFALGWTIIYPPLAGVSFTTEFLS
jgi:hypothetical protein